MTDTLRIEYIPLDESVHLWQRNPKQHDLGALIRSFERHGFKQPPRYEPALNTGAGGIVAGNGRIEALMAMRNAGHDAPRGIAVQDGTWYVPVLFGVDAASQAAAEAFGLDDNALTVMGGDFTAIDTSRMYDSARYLDMLQELANQDELPVSVDGDDLDALLAYHAPEPDVLEDEPVSVDETKPTRCQPGDVWQVGRHLVACLDSTDAASIERLVQGRRVGMVVADPPYGVKAVGKDGRIGSDYNRNNTPGYERFDGYSANVYAPVIGDESTETARSSSGLLLSLYEDAVHIWWGANNYADALPPSTCWIVWDKENDGDDFPDAELAWCNDGGAVRIFRHMWKGMLKASEVHDKRVHPTQKPIALFQWLYEKYGSAGDLIVDPFLGSGPSLKAAEVSGRTVIGCELSAAYIDHILEWAEGRGIPVERVDTPMNEA